MIGIDDLDVLVRLDIRGGHGTLAVFRELQGHVIAVVQFQHDALEVQQDVDHVLLDPVQRRVLVQDARDLHFGRRVARHGRQQDAAKRIPQCMAVPTLERLHHHLRVERRRALYIDDARFQESVALHANSSRRNSDGTDPDRGSRLSVYFE